jgi:hypothetical protein
VWEQLPYIAKLEKAGIPTVLIDFEDQLNMVKQTALRSGIPNVRYVHASRTLPGPQDVDTWMDKIMDALTVPLTDKEKESGTWVPTSDDRIIFEGTMDEAEEFFHQTEMVPHPVNAPIARFTDGLPVRIPTEERVAEMLKGTSHKPDEIVTYQSDRRGWKGPVKKGDPVLFHPMNWTATVEKVAACAVMAGCKPEHFPAVLAIAESTCYIASTHTFGQWLCVSGPYAKEVGMNSGCGMLGPGNVANSTIGRTYEIMARNLGGAIPGVNRMTCLGSPFEGSRCCAENADGLPPGWKGLNEEGGYRKDESVMLVHPHVNDGIRGVQFSPGGYRAFQKSGHGGIARKLGVKGMPGPHNWLEYLLDDFWTGREGAKTIIMVPEMARHLYEYGFKSKEAVYEWLYQKSFIPLSRYRNYSWVDLHTNGWLGVEPISGKHWKELPDDYLVPAAEDPFAFCIVVGGGDEEVSHQLSSHHHLGINPFYSIDAWR